jgi:hypothetical protein
MLRLRPFHIPISLQEGPVSFLRKNLETSRTKPYPEEEEEEDYNYNDIVVMISF